MKIKKKNRLLSLFFSLALVISAFGAGLPASADGESVDTITKVDSFLWETANITNYVGTDGNKLKGQFCDVSFVEDGKTSDVESNYSDYIITDSSITAGDTWLKVKSGELTADSSQGQEKNYWRMVFKLDGNLNDPKYFIFGSHKDKDKHPSHYSVFVAEKYEDLNDNKLIDISRNDKRALDLVNIEQYNLNLKNIGYIEIRIYNTGATSWAQPMTELGFFGGTVVEDNAITAHTVLSSNTNAQNAVTAAGVNRLAAEEYEKSTYYSNGNLCQNEEKDINKNWFTGTMVDSNIGAWHSTGQEDSCQSYELSNDAFQTESYRQINFTLSNTIKNPEKFIMTFHPSVGIASKHYAVYMSCQKDTLYDETNKVIEITDSDSTRIGDMVNLADTELNKIKYVGIRIYHFGYKTNLGCKIQHISQIGLYGGSIIGPMGDMNMDNNVDILDLVRLKRYNADSTVAIDADNELLVDFEGSSAQLTALRKYLLTGSWYEPTMFADEGYTYVWGDEFNAKTLNSDKWENGDAKSDSDIIRSNETNLSLANGSLNLKVNGVTNEDGTTTYYTSEGLRTHSTMNFQYGYLEMKIKAPVQSGVWPGFWLSGLNGPYSDVFKTSLTRDTDFTAYGTEIDILEQYRTTDEFYTSLHKWYPGNTNALKYNKCTYKFDGEYHIYGFKWTHDEMSVYVDGAKCYSYDLSENFDKTGYNTTMDGFRSPHYLRITNGLDKAATGYDTPLTADVDCTLSVDWIRLYQIPGVGGLWTK